LTKLETRAYYRRGCFDDYQNHEIIAGSSAQQVYPSYSDVILIFKQGCFLCILITKGASNVKELLHNAFLLLVEKQQECCGIDLLPTRKILFHIFQE